MSERKVIIPTKVEHEDYWACKRCGITSDTPDRMIPCPRGGCDAECVGEKEIKTTVYEREPKLCDCGKKAKWVYMPSSNMKNPYCCDDCVPRGCSCNEHRINNDFNNAPTTEDGLEGVGWKWLDKGITWVRIDEKGRQYPCSEWEYDFDDNNFADL